MNRRALLTGLMALPVLAVAGPAEYTTPVGDEPIEVLVGYRDLTGNRVQCWVEWPFDELVPGDILRRKRDPTQEYEVDDPFFWDGVGITVTTLP